MQGLQRIKEIILLVLVHRRSKMKEQSGDVRVREISETRREISPLCYLLTIFGWVRGGHQVLNWLCDLGGNRPSPAG
jgi:hypothetical protein